MSYVNLPGAFAEFLDGNLGITTPETDPRILVLGTAESGISSGLWKVGRTSATRSEFGIAGTLLRGMYEASAQGAKNIYLMRIGGTPAVLSGVGCTTPLAGLTGYTITTMTMLDDAAGTSYFIYYLDSSDLLVIFDTDMNVVYSNDPTDPVDLGVVSVTGRRCASGGPDFGTPSAPITFAAAAAAEISVTLVAGSDQSNPSRMELFEALYNAYELLDFQQFDVVVPQDAFINDLNVVDLEASDIIDRGLAAVVAYPTAKSRQDVLGKVFVQKYQGTNYFWWDVNGGGSATIVPTVGFASSVSDANGDALTAGSFNEVNFGYQLADFCYNSTENFQASIGCIGVTRPNSLGLADVATWIGSLPDFTVNNITEASTILNLTDNGSGLLGNKFMAGKDTFRGGAGYGGFIATDSGFVDGTELTDDNDQLIDIGKYLSVVGAWVTNTNATDTSRRGYLGSFAAGYGGMITRLGSASAPTNKTVSRVGLPYRIPASTLDDLAGARYIMLVNKPKGMVVADAPTAARPGTDWTRLTTMRITAEMVQRLRNTADPFLGEAISSARISALNTAIEQTLNALKSEGKIKDFRFNLVITAQDAILGNANLELVIVPAFELRRIFIMTSLAGELT